jgi:spore coat protein A
MALPAPASSNASGGTFENFHDIAFGLLFFERDRVNLKSSRRTNDRVKRRREPRTKTCDGVSLSALPVIDRRHFLGTLFGGGAGLALGAPALARAQVNPWVRSETDSYGQARAPTYTRPLAVPKVLKPLATAGDVDRFELEIQRGLSQPVPGKATEIWGYAGVWPGPTLEVTRGRAAQVRVHNRLSEPMSVHNHGICSPPDSDGHPLDLIRPGAFKDYHYPNQQAAGTYWLHDHAFGLTGAHVYRGLASFYIVRDPAEDALGLPSGEFDLPIVLQDRLLDAENALEYRVDTGSITTGFLGNTLCANGVHTPYLDVRARKYRFRLLNGANARNLRLALGDGSAFTVVACDGALLRAPVRVNAVELAPAERADIVIDFARYPLGTQLLLTNTDPTWPVVPDVLRFQVLASEKDTSRVPARLAHIEPLDPKRAAVTRKIRFQLSDGKWTLNGLRYDPGRIDFRPRLGSTEVWELVNDEATQMHPFHQHLVPFQILDINGRPPPPEQGGWKDTVAVPPHGTARIIMRFAGYTGVYVFHCHKLEHEDHAMMLQQEVV